MKKQRDKAQTRSRQRRASHNANKAVNREINKLEREVAELERERQSRLALKMRRGAERGLTLGAVAAAALLMERRR